MVSTLTILTNDKLITNPNDNVIQQCYRQMLISLNLSAKDLISLIIRKSTQNGLTQIVEI